MHDTDDTIVAIATAPSGAARGAVRVSGPAALTIVSSLTDRAVEAVLPAMLPDRVLRLPVAGEIRSLPCDLLVWPDARSYTRQPTVEVHTVGSPPLLEALVNAFVEAGARLAEPGEFTLRSFLAGRLDLTQAEAVLAVIDARHAAGLDTALAQLAGGLSEPLHRLRGDLLGLLADLEAGLDFVEEEDVRFVEPSEVVSRIRAASDIVTRVEHQIAERGDASRLPRAVIVGPPNVGKSTLFNALVTRYGFGEIAPALVADRPGVTRDALRATVRLGTIECELIDTAGDGESAPIDTLDAAARDRVADVRGDADLLIECHRAGADRRAGGDAVAVATMVDVLRGYDPPADVIATSAETGVGVDALAACLADRLAALDENSGASVAASTAARCRGSLSDAEAALERAADTAASDGGDELVALELRAALDAVGRVVGAVVADDVLDQIFSKFCIGK